MLTFLRIESRGGNLVAVFDRGYQSPVWTPDNTTRYDDGTFCLNKESLQARIANVQSDGKDASVEKIALAALAAQEGEVSV